MSTTGASDPVVSLDLFAQVERRRDGRPLVVLDLAVPRDFDPRIGYRPGVWLYSIDDLAAACEANRRSRQRELPAALAIVDEETRRFMGDCTTARTAPVIEQLRAGWTETGEAELDRLFRRLPGLDDGRRGTRFARPSSGTPPRCSTRRWPRSAARAMPAPRTGFSTRCGGSSICRNDARRRRAAAGGAYLANRLEHS